MPKKPDASWRASMGIIEALVKVLTKTPVRDTANNPVMQPVPIRPHLLISPTTATLADFLAYKTKTPRELLNPNDKQMNHRPTDAAIKSFVMLALGSSLFAPYSILAQRYRQNDHANKTWTDLRMDKESIINNNNTGTFTRLGHSHAPTRPNIPRMAPLTFPLRPTTHGKPLLADT
jgi:hypothetical protein